MPHGRTLRWATTEADKVLSVATDDTKTTGSCDTGRGQTDETGPSAFETDVHKPIKLDMPISFVD